jgi:hypothetical protein
MEDGTPLPHRWEVCDLCNGKGTHVNPSIDSGGLSAEMLHDDPDFSDNYRDGMFDQQCNQCGGRTTVPVADVSRCTWAQKRRLVELRQDERARAECDAESAAERAMGA